MSRLEGKVALITGGGTGIGAAIAERFVRAGARVAVMGRRPAPLEQMQAAIGALPVVADTSDAEGCRRGVAEVVAALGKLDIVVANAGVMSMGNTVELDPDEWEDTLRVNVSGVMHICRAALPGMVERGGGAIVTISSVAGLSSMQDAAAYVTSKHALQGFTKTLAVDYGPSGIRANALAPGWVRTPMSDEEMQELAKMRGITAAEATALTVEHLPLGRMAEPEEIAACAEFLASDDAGFVTGATLVADGGGEVVDVGALAFKTP